jgi:hypothetical protein
MPAHCTKALKDSTPTATIHPCARLCTPPLMITTKDTRAQSSTTTPKLVRKPTVRHILQKLGSFVQSLMRGKGTHVPVTAEQRECRPYEYSRWPEGEYETQRGMAMEAMVMMVAVGVLAYPLCMSAPRVLPASVRTKPTP